jgi:hypothetical protein
MLAFILAAMSLVASELLGNAGIEDSIRIYKKRLSSAPPQSVPLSAGTAPLQRNLRLVTARASQLPALALTCVGLVDLSVPIVADNLKNAVVVLFAVVASATIFKVGEPGRGKMERKGQGEFRTFSVSWPSIVLIIVNVLGAIAAGVT